MAENVIGTDIAPPDLRAKITGQARYAEDFRAEGMVFAKLLLSPMPHARVRSVDTSAAERMEGVLGILRAEELPIQSEGMREAALTDEPKYEGEPILAVAAVDETTAAAAVEAIRVDLEPLPFVLDPLESLREGGPDAHTGGNVAGRGEASSLKWPASVFEEAGPDRLPMGEAPLDLKQASRARVASFGCASWHKANLEAAQRTMSQVARDEMACAKRTFGTFPHRFRL